MTAQLFAGLMLAGVIVGFTATKLYQLRKTRQENDRLQAENQRQQAQIHTQQEVIKNAEIQQKHNESVNRASDSSIDRQLHERNYYRD